MLSSVSLVVVVACFQLSQVLSLSSAPSQPWSPVGGKTEGCDYCSIETTMLNGSDQNKKQLQKAFNPPNFASSDVVYVYYITNSGSRLPPVCIQTQFQNSFLPLPMDAIGLNGNGYITLMVWTSTPVHMLVPPFVIQEFGLCSFPLSSQTARLIPLYSPSSACVLVERQACSSGEDELAMEQLTVRLSLYSIQFKSICKDDTSPKSYAFGSQVKLSPSSILVANLLYGAILLVCVAYIPVSIRYKQVIYNYAIQQCKKRLSISYSFVWAVVICCSLVNFGLFIAKGVLSLVHVLLNSYIMHPWLESCHYWLILYILLYLTLPLFSQLFVALSITKEEDMPYPHLFDLLLACCVKSKEKRCSAMQTWGLWMTGAFCHFIVMSLPFTFLSITANPAGSLSWPSMLILSFLAGCCVVSVGVTLDRHWHEREGTKTSWKETFYLSLYYLACFTIAAMLAVLMLILSAMAVLDKVQTKPGVTNMISFLTAPLLLACLGYLTRLSMHRMGDSLVEEEQEEEANNAVQQQEQQGHQETDEMQSLLAMQE